MTDIHSNQLADWRDLDLLADNQRVLIEASAGTGKTWTIASIYLRCVLQHDLRPRQIMVATFSNAAADELKARIRERLLWALNVATAELDEQASARAEDDVAKWLLSRWQETSGSRRGDALALSAALSEFELAPIATLHGICHRILKDHPFASATPFDLGELIDGNALIKEVATDLWRLVIQDAAHAALDADAELLRDYADALSIETLQGVLRIVLAPGATVAQAPALACPGQTSAQEIAALRRYAHANCAALTANTKLRRGWVELADILEDRTLTPSEELLEILEKARDKPPLLKSAENDSELLALLDKMGRQWLPFVQQRVAQLPQIEPLLLAAIQRLGQRLLRDRLAQLGKSSFDELIIKVHALLAADSPVQSHLADALYQGWPVAMVDEFQDTDAYQYAIIDRIYRQSTDSASGARGRLLMIGDPKQAIYRFRGGDIHTYARAAAQQGVKTLRLSMNFRSSAAMVAAFNEFYAACGSRVGAGSGAIAYQSVNPSQRRADCHYAIGGEVVAKPLVFHFQPALPSNTDQRIDAALSACADHIAGLLQSDEHTLADRQLLPSDIAILLPQNRQVAQLRDLLSQRGVPCVSSSQESVFASACAADLLVLLYAVYHCHSRAAVLGAMATRLYGGDLAELQALSADPQRWHDASAVFREWHSLWMRRGVKAVVMALTRHIAKPALDTAQGERLLTDLRHLGELLQTQSEVLSGAEELLVWFREQFEDGGNSADVAADALQLRIESDAKRVRIMTLHASKGLEFNIVFLPLLWAHSIKTKAGKLAQLVTLMNADAQVREVLSSADALRRDRQEQHEESHRLLYVALTRAVHACHVYVLDVDRVIDGNTKKPVSAAGAQRSALDAVMGALDANAKPLLQRLAMEAFANLCWHHGWDFAAPVAAIRVLAECAPRHARVAPIPSTAPLPGRHSFSTLSNRHAFSGFDAEASAGDENNAHSELLISFSEGLDDPVDDEAGNTSSATAHEELNALAAVAGPDFGNAVHAIFEHRQPLCSLLEQGALVQEKLQEFNVGSRDIEPAHVFTRLSKRLQTVLETPLGSLAGPRLLDLSSAQMRAEMAFDFALAGSSLRTLRADCTRLGDATLVPDKERALVGMMTGKIDLLFEHDGRFHVLDYKGNRLGDADEQYIENYQGNALLAKMDSEQYRFQALLYTVAVERYLQSRLGDAYSRHRHLGDCWYLFIRAVGLSGVDDPGCGIWRHRFSDGIVDAAQREFSHGRVEVMT